MPLLTLTAAISFACVNPAHRDGKSIRCSDHGTVMALAGIAVPPVASAYATRPCPADPGTAVRDRLAELTRGQALVCTRTADRTHVRCTLKGEDLSCRLLAEGLATAATPAIACPKRTSIDRGEAILADGARDFVDLPPLWRWIPLYLAIVNTITFLTFAADKRRAITGINRISEVHLLLLVLFGGGIGGIFAQLRLDHLRDQQPFAAQFAILIGLQIGILIGVTGLLLT
ncbi:MAG: DUF1294 domain-containing protein [Polymorphobacter sp.]